jgi:hypothetical protein
MEGRAEETAICQGMESKDMESDRTPLETPDLFWLAQNELGRMSQRV